MQVRIGDLKLDMGEEYVSELRESNDILGDFVALRRRMQEGGYLLSAAFMTASRS